MRKTEPKKISTTYHPGYSNFNDRNGLFLCGYLRKLKLFNVLNTIPIDIIELCIFFVPKPPIIQNIYIPQTEDSDDNSSTSTSTDSSNILSDSDSNERTHKIKKKSSNLPKWRKYWTVEELQNKYLPIKQLDRDTFHISYKAISTFDDNSLEIKSGSTYVITKFRKISSSIAKTKTLLRELKVLNILQRHQCFIRLYHILPPIDPENFKTVNMVFEYTESNLCNIFRTNQYFSSFHIEYILYQLLLGINYMHSCDIIHRNITPENILINSNCSIKISDFARAITCFDNLARKKLKRKKRRKYIQLSLGYNHIVKHYRAPEVILRQQKQETLAGMDMWSFGCIFGELLQMQKENCQTVWKRGPLFPQELLSISGPIRRKKRGMYTRIFDQINVIVDLLGTPTKGEIAKLTDRQVITYLEDLPKQKGYNLNEMFPVTSNDGIDLLENLIQFDVDKRLSSKNCLGHQYFQRVRNVDLENESIYKFDSKEISSTADKSKFELWEMLRKEIL
eukprot:40067_1